MSNTDTNPTEFVISQTEFASKLLVINSLYYAGMSKDLSHDRSDAVIIRSQDALHIILGAVLSSVMRGKIDLKRIEVIKAKEVAPNATL